MKRIFHKPFLFFSLLPLFLLSYSNQSTTEVHKTNPEKNPDFNLTPKVIYGDDNRFDLYSITDLKMTERAHSTVALIRGFKVKPQPNGTHEIDSPKFNESYNLCSDERFAEQPVAAFCSGFLVAPNIIATAGHCMQNHNVCQDSVVVFGYALNSIYDTGKVVDSENVYRCKKIIHTQIDKNGSDFAIFEIDRIVMNQSPLPLRINGSITLNDKVTVIGHPTGLPTKVTTSGVIRDIQPTYFISNLDTYGGNSGSAVINENTGDVEGILVRGAQDYKFENGCLHSVRCKEDECRGEDATLIKEILNYLPEKSLPN